MVKSLSVLLSFLLAATPVFAAPTDSQTAGEVKALIPAAWRNAQTVKAKDSLDWNDLLQTSDQGRLRAGLTDGSILSLGSNSALRIVQHDAASQQTSMYLGYGKLRSQVVKITKPDGKFEVRTPNAVIGVIGTDVFVGYDREKDITTVICYTGKCAVTSVGTAKVVRKSDQANADQAVTTLAAGQLVMVGLKLPPEGLAPESEVIQASMQDTNVNPRPVIIAQPKVWIPILGVVVGGVVTGVVVSTRGGGSAAIPPPVVCGVTPRGRSQPQCQ
jgi:hypothetical protein